MNRIASLSRLLLVFFALTSPALALQDDPGDAQRAQQRAQDDALRQQEADRALADAEAGQAALRAFLHDNGDNSPPPISRSAEVAARFRDFRLAVPKFRTATSDFRWALSIDAKLGKPLKDIETQTDIMLRYLAVTKRKHPPLDAAEFKNFSQNELAWEMLNSAERISSFLDVAVAVEKQDVVDLKMAEFMNQLDGELARLKWLGSHVK